VKKIRCHATKHGPTFKLKDLGFETKAKKHTGVCTICVFLLCVTWSAIISDLLMIQQAVAVWQNVFSESEMVGWKRHWCVLDSDQISLWDHPVAEIYKVLYVTLFFIV